jgi:hypothetical protein
MIGMLKLSVARYISKHELQHFVRTWQWATIRQGSTVDVVSSLHIEHPEETVVRFPLGAEAFPFSAYTPILGPTRPSVQWATGAASPGLKWQDLEADNSPWSSAEVKSACNKCPLHHPSSWRNFTFKTNVMVSVWAIIELARYRRPQFDVSFYELSHVSLAVVFGNQFAVA